MPIQLRTGLPGAGKTLGAVEHLIELSQREPHRPRYQHGITDLKDGLAIPLDVEQVKDWQSLPPNSIIMIDECQKLMPAKRGAIDSPQWVRDLSTHRHLGLDFILITQHPSLIDKYVRTLVDVHIHTVRKYGTNFVERWRWGICKEDPNAKGAQKDAEAKTTHAMSKVAMQAYKSAEIHTVKRRIPRFVYIGAITLVLIPLLAWLAVKFMHRTQVVAAGGHESPTGSAPLSGKHATLTRDEWIQQQVPRVAGIPWSAPIYDDRKVQSNPDIYCVAYGGEQGDDKCMCKTEQGTRAEVPFVMCQQVAHGGIYNPYRSPSSAPTPPQGQARTSGTASAQPSQPPASGAPSGTSWPAGVGAQTYTPPAAPGSWNPNALAGGTPAS
ncbi:hypothetical protein ISP17_13450 [Dyella ginsengisoli]|uniref:Zona occludens toxin N-terminal domain-containing protein n=1 Tax=Dyella ginsengisoli TaxID=363848 RepID=A0ABW8JXR0_9GAMM